DASYRLFANPGGFSRLSLSFGPAEGALALSGPDSAFHIPFSFHTQTISILEEYKQRIAVQGMWAGPDTLYLPVQIAGECVGSIHFLLRLSDERVTVWMKKIEETYFHEFQGFLEGVKE
ncbi:hypothetical protein, partial [Lacrimispora sp.]